MQVSYANQLLNGTVGSGGATGGGGQATGLAAELNAAAMSASNTYGNGERGAYEKEAVPISEMHVKKGKELVGIVLCVYIYICTQPPGVYINSSVGLHPTMVGLPLGIHGTLLYRNPGFFFWGGVGGCTTVPLLIFSFITLFFNYFCRYSYHTLQRQQQHHF